MNAEATLIPPKRLGALLSTTRSQRGLTIGDVAAASQGQFTPADLERYERGQGASDELIQQITRLYGVNTGEVVPARSRLVVDLANGQMGVGDQTLTLPSTAVDDVLERYLALLYMLRNLRPGAGLTLRDRDLVVLSETLQRELAVVEQRLGQLMLGQPVAERHRLLRGRLAVPAAGLLVAATAAGTLIMVSGATGSNDTNISAASSPEVAALSIGQVVDAPVRAAIILPDSAGSVSLGTATIGNVDSNRAPTFEQVSAHELGGVLAGSEAEDAQAEDAPAIEDETPAVEDDAPAVEDEAPAAEAPAVEDEAPAAADEAPAAEDEAPAAADEAPAAADEAPAAEDEAPAVEEAVTASESFEAESPVAGTPANEIVIPSADEALADFVKPEAVQSASVPEVLPTPAPVAATAAPVAPTAAPVAPTAAPVAAPVQEDVVVTAGNSYEQLGAQAEAMIPYNFRAALPGWSVHFAGDTPGYRGLTNTSAKTITVYINSGDSASEVAGILAHEVAHALDVQYLNASQREAWLNSRGMPMVWWPGSGLSDFAVGAGDWAEAIAASWVNSPSDSHYGGFTADQLALATSFLP